MEENLSSPFVSDGSIHSIQFSLATEKEICAYSISDCPISHPSQLTNPFLGLPLESGKCEACGTSELGKCEGHFGYFQLPVPVYHPCHITELKHILSLVCLKCMRMKKAKVLHSLGKEKVPNASCRYCRDIPPMSIKEDKTDDGAFYLQLKVSSKTRLRDGFWSFLDKYGFHYGDNHCRTLLPSEALNFLNEIPEDTRRRLAGKGYFPQNGFILECLPVPPNCLYVPDISDGTTIMSADISISLLKRVLNKTEHIKRSRSGSPNFESHKVESNDLQLSIAQYMHLRGTRKAPHDITRKFAVGTEANGKSTKQWLEKMRTLFIRKGSGFSSRSVITGDAYKGINEIGLPSEIAEKITFEERVTVHNMKRLQDVVNNRLCVTYRDGSSTYAIAVGSTGHTFLKVGQVVNRRIMDGDIVFINRPPSTHKHSLQAFSVYIHDDHTVKINPLICAPLGADFDGDCVHLFYPQSLAAKAEVLELFSVEKQLLSSHTGNLNLQLVQDSLLALKLMFKTSFLRKATAQQLAMFVSPIMPPPALLKAQVSGPFWTVLQILQSALPAFLDCSGDRHLISHSEILKFDFNRDVLQSSLTDIITSVFILKGPKEALDFCNLLQPLLMEILFLDGFSVNLKDFDIPKAVMEDLQKTVQEISCVLEQLRSSYNELAEMQVENHLKSIKLPIVTFLLKLSALGNLIDSKSESSITKVVQQLGFLGLQLFDRGKFYSRVLVEDMFSHFVNKYSEDGVDHPSEAYGLIKKSFFHGLNPYEDLVHSISSREVIVRSSRGLTEPGTLFKNLMAILRDVVICYDGTVRNVCSNSIIQFEYGAGYGTNSLSSSPAGEPVGVLAATAISNPAYKAVLDSSQSTNSSWELMKEILLSKVNFKNDVIDRRVILYLNDCCCGKRFCKENAVFSVQNCLKRVTLKDCAIDFSIDYQKQIMLRDSSETVSGLVGHIHLNKMRLKGLKQSVNEILKKCEGVILSYKKKRPQSNFFRRIVLSARKMPRVIDPAWAHGMAIAGQRHKIKCNYCGKIINGGITRLKEHLAHRTGQVIKCIQVPKEVKMEMLNLLDGGKKKKHEREDVRRQEVDACREEVFGPGTDVDVDEDDSDQELSAALRESIHTHHLDEEGRRLSRQTGGVYGGIGGSSRSGGGGGLGSSLRRAFSTRRRDSYDVEEIERPASRRPHVEGPADPFACRKASATQTGIKSALSGMGSAAKKAVYKATGKFFLHNRIPPSVASSPYLQTMFDAAIEHGRGLKAPTPYDIGHHCVQDEYREAVDWVATFKQSWIDKGCTIMCDGWTSINRRSLINFMVYSPNGTVFYKSVDATEKVKNADYILSLMEQIVDDIGEQSVLQIVTDNEATYKAAGLRLMKTRKHLFWSPCAAHCVDLMIEEIAKKKWVAAVIEKSKKITTYIYNHNWIIGLMKKFTNDHELIRPGITRFATNFIALECLYQHRVGLQQMFLCPEWQSSKYGRMKEGPAVEVRKIVAKDKFWNKVNTVKNILEPLVQVLRLVDGDDKPTMGYIYEAMDRAKLEIKERTRYFQQYWDIIDERWEKQLHHDLHAAGYFLNPQFRYSNTCREITDEVRMGVNEVIKRVLTDPNEVIDAMTEMDYYNEGVGSFADSVAKQAIKRQQPTEWWKNFGFSAPHLRKVAIRVLSQTTSSSNCERNWSTFSLIHTKIRNRLTMQNLNKLVFINYNLRLRARNRRRKTAEELKEYACPINLDHIFSEENDPLAPWLEEVEAPTMDGNEELVRAVPDLEGNEPIRAADRLKSYSRRSKPQPEREVHDVVVESEDESSSSEDSPPHSPPGLGGGGDGAGTSYEENTDAFDRIRINDCFPSPGAANYPQYAGGEVPGGSSSGVGGGGDGVGVDEQQQGGGRGFDGRGQQLSYGYGNENYNFYGYGTYPQYGVPQPPLEPVPVPVPQSSMGSVGSSSSSYGRTYEPSSTTDSSYPSFFMTSFPIQIQTKHTTATNKSYKIVVDVDNNKTTTIMMQWSLADIPRGIELSEYCGSQQPYGENMSECPCLQFSYCDGSADPYNEPFEQVVNDMANKICPILLDTIVKGDPRVHAANVIWIGPEATSWVRNSCRTLKGELALEVVVEKDVVKRNGDAWRIVLDACLPVMHLIDSRRSIPYGVRQIQELLGISCAFDQSVQRLSTSIKMVAKGVLKEHLLLVANSMTCTGSLIGFNTGGYKALFRSLKVQVPFTESTLFTPMKCFERAAEKCHTDSLASIVSSCSWGKHVAIGTGTRFQILWDKQQIEDNRDVGKDVYDFLQLVRPTSSEKEVSSACLGVDVDYLAEENGNVELSLSPEPNNGFEKLIFEDSADLEDNISLENGEVGKSNWEKSSASAVKSDDRQGWENGKKPGSDNCSLPSPKPDVWSSWDADKVQQQPIQSTKMTEESDGFRSWDNVEVPKHSNLPDQSDAWGNSNSNDAEPGRGRTSKSNDKNCWNERDADKVQQQPIQCTKMTEESNGFRSWDNVEVQKHSLLPSPSDAWGNWKPNDAEPGRGQTSKSNDKNCWNESATQSKVDQPERSPVWNTNTTSNQKSLPGHSPFSQSKVWGSQDSNKLPGGNVSDGTIYEKEKDEWTTGEVQDRWARPKESQATSHVWDSNVTQNIGNIDSANTSPFSKSDVCGGQNSDEAHNERSSVWNRPKEKRVHDNRNQAWGSPGWGSSNAADRRTQKYHPTDDRNGWNANGNSASKGRRPDFFTCEEEKILVDIEPMMQSIRKILRDSSDGDRLSADDQKFILENVFQHHPDKQAKVTNEIDYIMVDRHKTYQDTRCFFVVSSDGSSADFSFLKCMENFIKESYPENGESFNRKYFRKRRNEPTNENEPAAVVQPQ